VTTAGRHSAEDGSFVRSASGAIARGAALVAVAVLIGVLLLARGLDSGELVTASGDDGGEETEGTSPGGTASSTTATTAPTTARPASEVRVLVANGSGIPGVAGQRTETLATAGYATLEPANAAPTPNTQVLFVEGFQAEAAAVATALGFPATVAQPLPDPPPVDPLDANVVVVLGQDTESA
jgi:LytR cell envelope-related transcriptional attenuator